MWVYPNINPIIFQIGVFQIHWYGCMYVFGLAVAWYLALRRIKEPPYIFQWTKDQVENLIFYGGIGLLLGGRLGYFLFYQMQLFLQKPLQLFKIWQGGMSFHGGLLGVLLAMGLFAYQTKKTYFEVTDFVAPLVPIGLGMGRIGNFINGELWGRVTQVPWGMIFPNADQAVRHPSQIYEFFLEGVLLFLLMAVYARKPRPTGHVSAVFLIGYGLARIVSECFREPDKNIGFIMGYFTEGQLLCIPMIFFGLLLIRKNAFLHK